MSEMKCDGKKKEESTHKLLNKINELTKFYVARIPNIDCLYYGLVNR